MGDAKYLQARFELFLKKKKKHIKNQNDKNCESYIFSYMQNYVPQKVAHRFCDTLNILKKIQNLSNFFVSRTIALEIIFLSRHLLILLIILISDW